MNRLRSFQLVPNGGWVFIESGVRLEADSFDSLVETVTKHRRSNGMAAGDPAQDVQNQICARQPDLCLYDWSAAAKHVGPIFERLLTGQIQLVDRIESSRRALICCACPKNVPSTEARVGCRTCGGRIKDQLLNLAANTGIAVLKSKVLPQRKVEQYENIHTCKVCGCDIELTTWLPKQDVQVKDKDRYLYPSFCWKL